MRKGARLNGTQSVFELSRSCLGSRNAGIKDSGTAHSWLTFRTQTVFLSTNKMKWISFLSLFLLSACSKSDLPPGYEIIHANTGWYLRTNGVALMKDGYQTREEALGQAWVWAGRATHQDGSHVKVDAVLSVSYRTNIVDPTTHFIVTNSSMTNFTLSFPGAQSITNYYRQVWISFDLSGFPFKGLVQEQPVVGVP